MPAKRVVVAGMVRTIESGTGQKWHHARWTEKGHRVYGPPRHAWIDAFVDLVTRPPLLGPVPQGTG